MGVLPVLEIDNTLSNEAILRGSNLRRTEKLPISLSCPVQVPTLLLHLFPTSVLEIDMTSATNYLPKSSYSLSLSL